VEAFGFWVAAIGWLLTILALTDEGWISRKAERLSEKLGLPWMATSICLLLVGIAMMATGWAMVCIHGQGRFPGYPLDILVGR
jgi:hypothetical protein